MTFDFSSYDPSGKTATMYLPIRGALIDDPENPGQKIEGEAHLIGRHAGDSNKAYMNGVSTMTTKAVRGKRKGPVSPNSVTARIAEDRDQDRRLFPDHVILSWGNMPSSEDRSPVEFSRERCREFCKALPDWIFDRVRTFFGNPINFVEDEDDLELVVTDEDVEEQAGN